MTTPNQRFKEIRTERRFSVTQFAKILGLTQPKVSDIEAGRQRVTPEIAKKIEDIFYINIRWLLFGEGKQEFYPKRTVKLEIVGADFEENTLILETPEGFWRDYGGLTPGYIKVDVSKGLIEKHKKP